MGVCGSVTNVNKAKKSKSKVQPQEATLELPTLAKNMYQLKKRKPEMVTMSIQTDPVMIFPMPNSNIRVYKKVEENTPKKEVYQSSTIPSSSSKQSVHKSKLKKLFINKNKVKAIIQKKQPYKFNRRELSKSQKSLQGCFRGKRRSLNSPVKIFSSHKLQTDKSPKKDFNFMNNKFQNPVKGIIDPKLSSKYKIQDLRCFFSLKQEKNTQNFHPKNTKKHDNLPKLTINKIPQKADSFFNIEDDGPSLDIKEMTKPQERNSSQEDGSLPPSNNFSEESNLLSNITKQGTNEEADSKSSINLYCQNELLPKIMGYTENSVKASKNSEKKKSNSNFQKKSFSHDMGSDIFSEMRTTKQRKKKNIFKFINQTNNSKTIKNLNYIVRNMHGKDQVMKCHVKPKTEDPNHLSPFWGKEHQYNFLNQQKAAIKHKPSETIKQEINEDGTPEFQLKVLARKSSPQKFALSEGNQQSEKLQDFDKVENHPNKKLFNEKKNTGPISRCRKIVNQTNSSNRTVKYKAHPMKCFYFPSKTDAGKEKSPAFRKSRIEEIKDEIQGQSEQNDTFETNIEQFDPNSFVGQNSSTQNRSNSSRSRINRHSEFNQTLNNNVRLSHFQNRTHSMCVYRKGASEINNSPEFLDEDFRVKALPARVILNARSPKKSYTMTNPFQKSATSFKPFFATNNKDLSKNLRLNSQQRGILSNQESNASVLLQDNDCSRHSPHSIIAQKLSNNDDSESTTSSVDSWNKYGKYEILANFEKFNERDPEVIFDGNESPIRHKGANLRQLQSPIKIRKLKSIHDKLVHSNKSKSRERPPKRRITLLPYSSRLKKRELMHPIEGLNQQKSKENNLNILPSFGCSQKNVINLKKYCQKPSSNVSGKKSKKSDLYSSMEVSKRIATPNFQLCSKSTLKEFEHFKDMESKSSIPPSISPKTPKLDTNKFNSRKSSVHKRVLIESDSSLSEENNEVQLDIKPSQNVNKSFNNAFDTSLQVKLQNLQSHRIPIKQDQYGDRANRQSQLPRSLILNYQQISSLAPTRNQRFQRLAQKSDTKNELETNSSRTPILHLQTLEDDSKLHSTSHSKKEDAILNQLSIDELKQLTQHLLSLHQNTAKKNQED